MQRICLLHQKPADRLLTIQPALLDCAGNWDGKNVVNRSSYVESGEGREKVVSSGGAST